MGHPTSDFSQRFPVLTKRTKEKVQRAAEWSESAFREVYVRYVKPIHAYIKKRVLNHQDAEDLTAHVFVQALDHLDPIDAASPALASWLFTSARNATANHRRSRRFLATVSVEEIDTACDEDPEGEAEKVDTLDRLIQEIGRLPEEQRKVLVLRFVDELPHADIGRLLGRTESSARVMLHRTVADLRRKVR